MPLLTDVDPASKRRLPVWALILAVVVLQLVAVFVWSWFQPVRLQLGQKWVAFEHLSDGSYIGWRWRPETRNSVGYCFVPLYQSHYRGRETHETYALRWSW
jgi:hypothetical protein